ncbi:hypothetical protein VQ03_23505 [Methylobacterium tarhaniae]|uniref:Polysaccharide pyruvyl transferase domain-containing protein n=1 Tax=Methylobacterium tarhaniae TaxID=1187852 RepID=A0A0J6SLS3_9HYPH|nr:hypothetical protein VQ03_23505 [Methylobacterium tarhaniae]
MGLITNLPGLEALNAQGATDAPLDTIFAALGGNSGNIAYVAGTRRILANTILIIDWSTPDEVVKAGCDAVVIACANQLGAHADLTDWAVKLERLNLPVVLIGLGAQADSKDSSVALTQGTRRFLDVVQTLRPNPRIPNIALRGEFSRSVLEAHGGHGVALSCPSLFLNFDPTLGAQIGATARRKVGCGFTFAVGNPFLTSSVAAEVTLSALARACGARCVVQHPWEMVALATGNAHLLPEVKVEFIRERMLPRQTTTDFLAWARAFWDLHLDIPSWIAAMRSTGRAVGARYHGVALGAQAGIPACVVAIDARTLELAETGCMPHVGVRQAADLADIHAVDDMWTPEHGARFDAHRADLAGRLSEFLYAQNLTPSENLKALARA